jgi:putative DNA primase/helicase
MALGRAFSGEDSVTVHQKYKKDWTGRLGVRLQLMSNEPPVMPDASGAINGRLLAIWLPNSFLGREEAGLDNTLRGELPVMLNWALDGLDRLNKNGRFTELTGDHSKALGEHLYEASSPLHEFIAERHDECAGEEVPKDSFFRSWRVWAMGAGTGQVR